MILTRDKGMRMWGGAGGNGGGGGGLNAATLAGFATQAWVDVNYVGIPFFNQLFTIHGKEVVTVVDGTTSEETTTTTERDLLPNEVAGTTVVTDEETGDVTTTVVTIESIEAKAGVWTNFFVSALGLNSDGGGGGGATTLAGLTDVQLTTPIGDGQALVYDSNLGKWKNATIEGGGGTGTVTSVAMSVPTGFRVTGSPITTSGTLALAFATGYSLPTTAKQANWDTAFSNAHTHDNKTVLDGITVQKVADWDDAVQGLSTVSGRVSTLEGYFTGGVANSAARLSGTAAHTVWGQTYWQNGVPRTVTGALSSVTDITMSGKITINNGQSVSFKDASGTARNVVTLNSSNSFALGYGTRKAGYVTDIQGAAASTAANTATAIQFKVGLTEDGIIGMKILKDGTVHIPTSSPGLRIGDALLTWDSANNALKLSAINGSGSVNFYATGGVSALGTN